MIVVVLMGLYTLPARGQGLTGWYPIERPAYADATTNYGNYAPAPAYGTNVPGPAAYAPATCACATISTRWEPSAPVSYAAAYAPSAAYAPPVAYAPVVNYAPAMNYVPMAAQYAAPRVTYMPVAARYPAQNYAAYAPVANRYAPAAPAGPKVWVHPKVYVEGQPIRNLIRAITP
jgi:hypothetical protein